MSASGQVMAQRVRALRAPLHVPAIRRLWAAQVLSELGDWAARLALSVLVYQRTGSAAATGITLAVSLVPWLGPGQLLTAWSERWSRRRVLVAADLVRAAMFVLAVLPVPVPLLLVLVFVGGLATPPFDAARSALRPELVPPSLLGSTIALSGMTQELSVIGGYVAGGALVTLVGPPSALLVNAATFVLSAVLLTGLPSSPPPRAEARPQIRLAWQALCRDPAIVRAVGFVTAATVCGSGVLALSAPFVLSTLDASPLLMTGFLVLASLVTLLVTALLRLDDDPDHLLRTCAVLLAVGGVLVSTGFLAVRFSEATALPGAAVGFVGLGLLFVVISPANVLVSPRLDARRRASALSLLMGLLVAAEAAGASTLGLAAAGWASAPVMAAAGLLPATVGAYGLARRRRTAWSGGTPYPHRRPLLVERPSQVWWGTRSS